ncbi:hypothetical protein [Bradyrhizobium diazoefficiens]|uniref:hypothetical protein n=1 Tax=Bradyrhizobium diazoefficiens TaxID=1355477 RepID=UPI003F7402EC
MELEDAGNYEVAPHRKTRDDAGRASKLLKIAAWGGVCFIAYATVRLLGIGPTLLISSNLEHLAAFAVLGALFCLAYPRRTPAVLIFVFGIALLEVLQLFTPNRHARTLEALQKIARGAAASSPVVLFCISIGTFLVPGLICREGVPLVAVT